MAKIRVELTDGQNLGYIQMRDGKPFYGYRQDEATDFPTVEDAKDVCNKLSSKYRFIIRTLKPKGMKKDKITVEYE